MNTKKYFIQNKELLKKNNGEELLLVDKTNGTFTKISGLALFIWNNLEKRKSFDEILNKILSNYNVDTAIANKDLQNFLKKATKTKIINTIDK